MVACENDRMATQATHNASTDSPLRLYRLDVGTYDRLVDAGALEGLDVALLDGMLVNKYPRRPDSIHRIDVGTYERMVATGALEGLPVELLEGLLVEVSPQGEQHAEAIVRLTRHLVTARAWLRVQLPLETAWGEVPEPDLALVEGSHPRHRHPRIALLAVEVAVSSHKQDRETKASMYAWAPVPTYWLIDVPGRAVEVRSEPGPRGYERCDVYKPGELVPSPAEGVLDLDVAWLFTDLNT
jgi:Uma2 family endonuclease